VNDDPRTKALQEWNRLARENTENAIVTSMLESVGKSSSPIESFTDWMLIATGAIASFILTNTEKVLPFVGKQALTYGGLLLCTSFTCGLLSKIFALQVKIGQQAGEAAKTTFAEHLEKHKIEEEKIKEGAKFWGITIDTGVRLELILTKFLAAMPAIPRYLTNRTLKKYQGNIHLGQIILLRNFNRQGIFAFLQGILLVFFFGLQFICGAFQ